MPQSTAVYELYPTIDRHPHRPLFNEANNEANDPAKFHCSCQGPLIPLFRVTWIIKNSTPMAGPSSRFPGIEEQTRHYDLHFISG